jgi:TetR/AcrR family transcriptional regulator
MGEIRHSFDAKLEHLLRTAASVFAAKGYHPASIRDISRATGTSLSGLYYYFRSKEELLFLIQDQCFATVIADLEARLASVEDPAERLRVLVDNHLRFFAANMDEMKVLSHEATALKGEFRQRVNARKKHYVEICESIMAGLRPTDSDAEHRAAALSLFGMMNWIYTWYHPDRDLPVEQLVESMSRIFLRGYPGDPVESVARAQSIGGARPSVWRR